MSARRSSLGAPFRVESWGKANSVGYGASLESSLPWRAGGFYSSVAVRDSKLGPEPSCTAGLPILRDVKVLMSHSQVALVRGARFSSALNSALVVLINDQDAGVRFTTLVGGCRSGTGLAGLEGANGEARVGKNKCWSAHQYGQPVLASLPPYHPCPPPVRTQTP